jgi:DNA-binding HxlR family transcriptional regulator
MGKAIEMSVRLDRVLLDQIAGRWHLLILSALCHHGHKARFNGGILAAVKTMITAGGTK